MLIVYSTKHVEKMQAKMRIHKDLSDLIYYVQSVHFHDFESTVSQAFYTMSSFPEKKAMAFAADHTSAVVSHLNPSGCSRLCLIAYRPT